MTNRYTFKVSLCLLFSFLFLTFIAKSQVTTSSISGIIKDGKGAVIEKISGAGSNYESDYAETENITVEFTSDSSEARFGAIIKAAKVIY